MLNRSTDVLAALQLNASQQAVLARQNKIRMGNLSEFQDVTVQFHKQVWLRDLVHLQPTTRILALLCFATGRNSLAERINDFSHDGPDQPIDC